MEASKQQRHLYGDLAHTNGCSVTDFYTRVAKIENPVAAAQYFDRSIFLSVVKQ